MLYENELGFLCDTFKKCRVRASVVAPGDSISRVVDTNLNLLLGAAVYEESSIHKITGNLAPCTMYKSTDPLGLCYIYLLLPTAGVTSILFVGPYLPAQLNTRQMLELGEKYGIPPKSQRFFEEYFYTIPVLPPGSQLFVMLDTFCERIWDSPVFSVVDVSREHQFPASPINEPTRSESFDDMLAGMKAMEKRYDFENEMMQAVSLGQIHAETQLFSFLPDQHFEQRTADPLRNAKNYCVIMNTLLRKAAENGGVHPVYLDSVSSAFAVRIEQLPTLTEVSPLMTEIFRSYCRLVRKHSMKDFPLVVQKTILFIDSNLSADLSLKALADSQNLSPSYLSTVFKKETGKTISEYIRDKRIRHAIHLLSTTHLQIQTVALHCGIMDVQYFSKLFKKHTGKTPKEYRRSVKEGQ
ncbi:MAG: helix-turn-helix transcriptional regulator [Clostridia bacterium]|nr:helix-turn-helix transcriptional regulator [Clostridia bacterium]